MRALFLRGFTFVALLLAFVASCPTPAWAQARRPPAAPDGRRADHPDQDRGAACDAQPGARGGLLPNRHAIRSQHEDGRRHRRRGRFTNARSKVCASRYGIPRTAAGKRARVSSTSMS